MVSVLFPPNMSISFGPTETAQCPHLGCGTSKLLIEKFTEEDDFKGALFPPLFAEACADGAEELELELELMPRSADERDFPPSFTLIFFHCCIPKS